MSRGGPDFSFDTQQNVVEVATDSVVAKKTNSRLAPKKVSRRDFLKLGGLVTGSAFLAGCGVDANTFPAPTSTNPPKDINTPVASPTPEPDKNKLPDPDKIEGGKIDNFREVHPELGDRELTGYHFGKDGDWIYAFDRQKNEVAGFLNTGTGWTQLDGAKVSGGPDTEGRPTEDVIWDLITIDGNEVKGKLVLRVSSPKSSQDYINFTYQSPITQETFNYQIDPKQEGAPKVLAAPVKVAEEKPEKTATLESQIKENYKVTFNENVDNMHVQGEIITDQSLDPTITKIEMPPKTGASFVNQILYKVYCTTNGLDSKDQSNYAVFTEKWLTGQLNIRIKTDNMGFVVINPNGLNETNNVKNITEFKIVAVNCNRFKGMKETAEGTGVSVRSEIVGSTLYAYFSPFQGGQYENRNSNTAQYMSNITSWLIKGTTRLDKDMRDFLVKNGLKVSP